MARRGSHFTRLLTSASSARSRYQTYLEEECRCNAGAKRGEKSTAAEEQLNELKRKRMQIKASIELMLSSAATFAEQAEEAGKITLPAKSIRGLTSGYEKKPHIPVQTAFEAWKATLLDRKGNSKDGDSLSKSLAFFLSLCLPPSLSSSLSLFLSLSLSLSRSHACTRAGELHTLLSWLVTVNSWIACTTVVTTAAGRQRGQIHFSLCQYFGSGIFLFRVWKRT